MNTIERDPRTHAIIGAAIEVHTQLGHGFVEPIYQEALAVELTLRDIPFRQKTPVAVFYKERQLAAAYRLDFVCFDEVVVELKAIAQLGGAEEAQLLNYLKATKHRVGLLLNFGSPRLEFKRFVFGNRPGSSEKSSTDDADEHR